jgi:hypothetical protein
MEGVRGSDLRAVLEFVELAWARAGRHAFPLETLEALAELIPCDAIGYTEIDRIGRRVIEYVGTDDDDDDDDLFWQIVDEHPLCRHQLAYADFSPKRLSDVISQQQLERTRVYAEWFRAIPDRRRTRGGDPAVPRADAQLRVRPLPRRLLRARRRRAGARGTALGPHP